MLAHSMCLLTLCRAKSVFVMTVSDRPQTVRLAKGALPDGDFGGARLMIGEIKVQEKASGLELDLPPLSTGLVRIQALKAAARP